MSKPGYVIGRPENERICFGSNDSQRQHAFRHVREADLPEEVVKQAVTRDLVGKRVRHQDHYEGAIEVVGHTLKYRAYRLPDGVIDVGRITVEQEREEPGSAAR